MLQTLTEDVVIPAGHEFLPGMLSLPESARGLVLFAHGSGSSRYSSRNQLVAGILNQAGFATLLFDLLSAAEHERDAVSAEYRFNIELLAERLVAAVDWAHHHETTRLLPIGLFGASTGAAAALVAAAELPSGVQTVISRGGRPDLAGEALSRINMPVLFIVGGWDKTVYELNRKAAARMAVAPSIVIVPEASHLFEEPGKLEEVAALVADWFGNHLGRQKRLPGQDTPAGQLPA